MGLRERRTDPGGTFENFSLAHLRVTAENELLTRDCGWVDLGVKLFYVG